jgi:hypothetical protein
MQVPSRKRRSLLVASALALPAIAVPAAARGRRGESLWDSAEVLIGNSPEDQTASTFIECPLYLVNGRSAGGSHTLDLADLRRVRGTITLGKHTIEPDFGRSVAASVTVGSDATPYLLVGGEGAVVAGAGPFRHVTRAIIRCKYKVASADPASILLIACIDCVIVLVRD